MPAKRRPPMPKLPPFALMNERPPRKAKPQHLFIFFLVFAIPLFLIHLQLLSLPYFWDELGQFIPTALDLVRSGAIVAHSTVPNVHPPGVAAYLALCYKIFGFSIPVTRLAMLLLASVGLLLTFLLAIELSQGAKGAPAFLPPILLLISPLFYTQSMMAQLDMPAMVFTLLALLLFVKRQYVAAMVACAALVLVKETGIVAPFVFLCVLAWRKDWKRAVLFVAPALVLFGWLAILHAKTGFWLGDAEFGRYNVSYALHPVRMVIALARRVFYLFFGEMRWVGTVVIAVTVRACKSFHTSAWAVVAAVGGLTIVLVSVFGGAELERYLMPVLPLFYIAVSVGLTAINRPLSIAAAAVIALSLVFFVVWNPPYPFPFENNYAMVDFVHLQQIAASYAERNLQDRKIATAWPYTDGLRNPDFGYVEHGLTAVETNDFHFSSVDAIPPDNFDTLIIYTREWAPETSVTNYPLVQRFLRHFYQWEPAITAEQCRKLGLEEKISFTAHGQTVSIFSRKMEHGQ
jgi:4-amino-4-deoxy-L-arabinose transferase-like glycosyltransferase